MVYRHPDNDALAPGTGEQKNGGGHRLCRTEGGGVQARVLLSLQHEIYVVHFDFYGANLCECKCKTGRDCDLRVQSIGCWFQVATRVSDTGLMARFKKRAAPAGCQLI